MEYMRKSLEDGAWKKFLIILNGGDPFPEPTLPQSIPVGDLDAAPEPDVPPELLAIENASAQAEAVCLKGYFLPKPAVHKLYTTCTQAVHRVCTTPKMSLPSLKVNRSTALPRSQG